MDVFDLQAALTLDASNYKKGIANAKSIAETFAKVGTAALAAVGTAAAAAGTAIVKSANDVAAYGDNVDKMSQKIGISAQAYQEWSYVFERCGTNADNLQTSMKILSSVIADAENGSSSAAKKLEAVGLSIDDLNNKSQDEQLSIIIAALQGMEAGARRTSAATDLLGRSATDMAAVFNTSAEETKRLKQEAQSYGMVMSDSAVKASAAFEDSLTKMDGTIRGVRNSMIGSLLPGITSIIDGISDLIVGNEKASKELKNGIASIVGNLTKMIPKIVVLLGSIAEAVLENAPEIISALAEGILSAIPNLVPTIVTTITSLIDTILELLPQVVETGAQIISSILIGISEALPELIPKITEVVTQMVTTLIDNLPLLLDAALKLMEGFSQGLLNALPVIISKLPQIITGIVNFIVNAIPEIIQAGITLLTSLVKALPTIISEICKAIPKIIEGVITAIVSAIPQIIQAGIELFVALITNLPTIIVEICKAIPKIIEGVITALINSIPQIIQAGIDLFVSLITNLPTIIVEICKAIPKIITGIVDGLVGSIGKIIEAGVKLFTSLITNLPTIISKICEAAPEIIQALVTAFGELGGELAKIGSNIVSGIWQGINGATSWLWEQVSGWLSGLWDGIKDFFGIASPSKEMAWIGEMLVSGLAGSIDKNGDQAVKSARSMASSVEEAFNSLPGDINTNIIPDVKFNEKSLTSEGYLEQLQDVGGNIGTRGAQVVNYNFEINVDNVNTNSDNDIEDLADRLMVVMQEKITRMEGVFA